MKSESEQTFWNYAVDSSLKKWPLSSWTKILPKSHTLCYTGTYILSDGKIRSFVLSKKLISLSQKYQVRLIPLITTSQGDSLFLKSEKNFQTAVDNLIRLLEQNQHLAGLHLDLESIPKSYVSNYVRFLRTLKSKLPKNKLLTVALFPQIGFPNPNYKIHSVLIDQEFIDEFVLMSYDLHSPKTKPGAVTSLSWTRENLNFLLEKIPSSKLWLGLPLYGYFWKQNGKVRIITKKELEKQPSGLEITSNPDGYQILKDKNGIGSISDFNAFKKFEELAFEFQLKGIAYWRLGF